MDAVARSTAEDRAVLFRETASRMGLPPALVEKDFWVCWTLQQLFGFADLKGRILFKGGTSLSKIFNAIRRFSEDIDLAVDYRMLGFKDERDPRRAPSISKRQGILKDMLLACRDYVTRNFLTLLRARFTSALGDTSTWELRARETSADCAIVEFVYPSSLSADDAVEYVRPMVVLEPGTHAELIPSGTFRVRPFAAEHFPQLFTRPDCAVEAITAERTFWEKATILHLEYHRPADKRMPSRHSRHYYDVAMLAQSEIKRRALADLGLLERVVHHKDEFYHCAWARYDLARPSSLRLVPPEERVADLKRDYTAMRAMIFGAAPSFEWIMRALQELEAEINARSSD